MTFFLHSNPVRLACLRQELGLTASNLSELLGVSPDVIESWEQGLAAVPSSVWDALDRLRSQSASILMKAES